MLKVKERIDNGENVNINEYLSKDYEYLTNSKTRIRPKRIPKPNDIPMIIKTNKVYYKEKKFPKDIGGIILKKDYDDKDLSILNNNIELWPIIGELSASGMFITVDKLVSIIKGMNMSPNDMTFNNVVNYVKGYLNNKIEYDIQVNKYKEKMGKAGINNYIKKFN